MRRRTPAGKPGSNAPAVTRLTPARSPRAWATASAISVPPAPPPTTVIAAGLSRSASSSRNACQRR